MKTPLDELKRQYKDCCATDPFRAGKIAFALATRARDEAEKYEWAKKSASALDRAHSGNDSIEACCAGDFVGGVPMPDLLHANLVRQRFGLAV